MAVGNLATIGQRFEKFSTPGEPLTHLPKVEGLVFYACMILHTSAACTSFKLWLLGYRSSGQSASSQYSGWQLPSLYSLWPDTADLYVPSFMLLMLPAV